MAVYVCESRAAQAFFFFSPFLSPDTCKSWYHHPHHDVEPTLKLFIMEHSDLTNQQNPLQGNVFFLLLLIFFFFNFSSIICWVGCEGVGHSIYWADPWEAPVTDFRASAASLCHSHSHTGSKFASLTYTAPHGNAQILNSLSEARDQTHVLMDTSWGVRYHWAMRGNS